MASLPDFDPYHRWLGISPKEQPPNLYRLLALEIFESDREVIELAADQRMTHLKTFQTGTHGPLSQRLLNEVSAARVCLLNPARKFAYDVDLRAKLGPRPSAAQPPAPPINPAPSYPTPLNLPATSYQAPIYHAPLSPQAEFEPSQVIDSNVVLETAPLDFNQRGDGNRKGASRAKKSRWKGPGKYNLVLLVVGIVGLAAVLLNRASNRQPSVADAEQSTITKQPSQAKQVASATEVTKKPRAYEVPKVHTHISDGNKTEHLPRDDGGGRTTATEPATLPKAVDPGTNAFTTKEPEPATRDMPRNRWVHSKGSFQKIEGNEWVEQAPDGSKHRFKEFATTADYIELHLNSGVTRVKLYSDHCDVSFQPFSTTTTPYQGQWEALAASSNQPKSETHKEPANADADGWLNLLAWAEEAGSWTPRGYDWDDACEAPPTKDGVTLKSRPFNHFPLPAIIDGDYEIEAEFTRQSGDAAIALFFPVGIHTMDLEVGGNRGTAAGVSWIDGKWFNENGTVRNDCPVPINQSCRLTIRVQHSSDDAEFHVDWQGQKDFLFWKGAYERLTNADGGGWKLSMVRHVWLGAWNSKVTFHKVRIRMISGEVRRDFSTATDRQKDLSQGYIRLIDLPANTPKVGWGRFCINQIPLDRGPSEEEWAWPLITQNPMVCKDYYGAHAPSRLKCPIPKNAKSFSVTGLNQASRTVKYFVYIDGRVKFESGVTDVAAISVPIPVKSSLLELVVDPAGLLDLDHSYWCNPQFHGSKPGKLPFTVATSSVGAGAFTHNKPIDAWATAPPEPRDAVPCDEFLYAHANSSLSYRLPDGMRRFTACGYCLGSSSVKFQVWADSRMIYESPVAGIVPMDVNLPVGTKTVELKVDSLGNGLRDWSMWCFPRFHRAGGSGR